MLSVGIDHGLIVENIYLTSQCHMSYDLGKCFIYFVM